MPGFRGARSNTDLYRTTEHKGQRRQLMAQLEADGSGLCAERICIKPSRLIHAAMGSALHLCHDRPTGAVLGLGHAACNQQEAARYGGRKAAALKAVRQGVTAPYW